MSAPNGRVVWIHQNFVTARQTGNSRPTWMLDALRGAGWRVDVITTSRGYLDDRAVDNGAARAIRVETDGLIRVHRLPLDGGVSVGDRRRSYFQFFTRATRYAMSLGPVDVVYCSTPPPPQLLASILLAVARRAAFVFEVRDLWPAFIVAAGVVRSRVAIAAMNWMQASAIRFADDVVSVSPSYVPYLRACGVPEGRLQVIPTGGDPRELGGHGRLRAEWRRTHGVEERFVVLYAGSFNDVYDIEHIIAIAESAARTQPELHVVLAGNGRSRRVVEDAARRLPNLRYIGALPRDALAAPLAGADCGLVTLAGEAPVVAMLPGKLFEYMAAGLPVVSTVAGQTGAIVRAARAGIVVSTRSQADVVRALCDLAAQSRGDRVAMGARGRAWVLRWMPSDAMGDRAAGVVIAARRSAGSGRMWKCARAFSGAAVDVMSGRPGRALAPYRDAPAAEATIHSAFESWLATARSYRVDDVTEVRLP